ncbi:hypothetical protein LzC2_26480 [Planctomycetes bacterium LzC2]|uniref:Uncharacterized protein n=1 Tax=Alienimonas chondri TaxID=2681879 RepID=A0ABX1VEN3_9PLAN|nr:hypothetical protein [Alienimonas chondri]
MAPSTLVTSIVEPSGSMLELSSRTTPELKSVPAASPLMVIVAASGPMPVDSIVLMPAA